LTLVAYEYYLEENKILFALTILSLLFFTVVTLTLQLQLFVGILLGGAISHLFFIIVDDYIYLIDESCLSMVDYKDRKSKMYKSFDDKINEEYL